MSIQVAVLVSGLDAFLATLVKLDPSESGVQRRIGIGLRQAGELVQSIAAEKKIVRGRGKRAKPLPDRLSGRTGALAGSIAVDTTRLPKEVRIGTALVYGPVHELGLAAFPKRPFLAPAVVDAGKRFEFLLEREWTKGVL